MNCVLLGDVVISRMEHVPWDLQPRIVFSNSDWTGR